MDTLSKRCIHCGEIKQLEEFHKDKQRRDGLDSRCKVCRGKEQAARYQIHGDKQRAQQRAAYAANPDKKNQSAKQWQKDNPDKVRTIQKRHYEKYPEKRREATRLSRKKNIDKRKAYERHYRQQNPNMDHAKTARRQAKRRNLPSTFTASDWQRCLEYFNHRCAICGKPRGLWHTLAMDHWIPLSDPQCPGTVVTNMLPLCHGEMGCNNSKGSKPPLDWLIERLGVRKAKAILKRIEDYFEWCKRR